MNKTESLAEAWPQHAHNVISEIKMRQATTGAINKTESKAEACGSPPKNPRWTACEARLGPTSSCASTAR